MFENVPGLVRPAFRSYFDQVLEALRSPEPGLKYGVTWSVLQAADYGVPQLRRRLFVIAVREDVAREFNFPPPTHGDPGDSLQADNQAESQYRRLPWRTVAEATADLPEPGAASAALHEAISGAKLYRGHSGSGFYRPAKTVKAGVHGVPGGENILLLPGGGHRYFTLRELARLQTFPDEYTFIGSRTAITKQIGNAVPPRLAHTLGCEIATALSSPAAVR